MEPDPSEGKSNQKSIARVAFFFTTLYLKSIVRIVMKKNLFLSLLLVIINAQFSSAKTTVGIVLNNYFDNPINIEIRPGGKFGGGGIPENVIAAQTIGPKQMNLKMSIKVDKKDLLSVIGRFSDGSSYLFYQFTVPADGSSIGAIDLNPSSSQKLKTNHEFLKDLENSFYNPVSNLIYRVDGSADDAFKQFFGALAIVKKENGKYIEIDRIRPEVLKNNEIPKFVKDRAKNFDYTFSSLFVSENRISIPSIVDVSFTFNAESSYRFNYTAVGFGKIFHNDPDGKSIEDRFADLSEQTKNSFLATLALDTSNSYEVRVYNEAFAYKGMYLKIEELTKSNFNDKVSASTFFSNDGGLSRSTRQAYEEVFGQTVLAVGFNGENKTAYFKGLAKNYLESLKVQMIAKKLTVSEVENIFNQHRNDGVELTNIKDASMLIDQYLEKIEVAE